MNYNEKRTLDLPYDTNLAFFTYGIFKPGQLAYSKIRNHVDEAINDVEVNYTMKHRDGVPILINKENDQNTTNGTILTFKQKHEETAYNIISNTLLRKLYEWKTITINGEEVNVLFGVNPNNGSDSIENPIERVNFDGKNDPFFNEVIKLIEKNLNSNKFSWNMENFFELQMNYMMLWSAIDRYCSLKYNKRLMKRNREKFAKEKAFKEGIKKFKDDNHMPVYSTDDLKIHEFNVEEPYKTLEYYYTLRCNVVHRGKAMHGDYHMLETAARELLDIFKDVLRDTFGED